MAKMIASFILSILLFLNAAIASDSTALIVDNSSSPLLSISLHINPEYKVIAAGASLFYNLNFLESNDERSDLILTTSAINIETGDVESFIQESLAVQSSLKILRRLPIPENAPPGKYQLRMDIIYKEKPYSAVESFEVLPVAESNGQESILSVDANMLIKIFLVLLILLSAFVLYLEHRDINEVESVKKRRRSR